MAKKLPSKAAWSNKWVTNSQNSVQHLVSGINGVTESPMEKAAQKQDKLVQNWTAAVNSGKWAAGLRAVSMEQWKKITAEKCQQRYSPGIKAAQPKMEAYIDQVTPHIENGLQQLESMPDLTLQDSIARSAFFITHMSNFKKS